jgi:hypothetical protein
MNTYKLTKEGVIRNSDGAHIPNNPDNRDWKKYLKWLDEDNTPDPIETREEKFARELTEEEHNLRMQFREDYMWHFLMLSEIWEVIKKYTPASNKDIDSKVLSKMNIWSAVVDRLREINE